MKIATAVDVRLVSPVSDLWWPMIWHWMQELPSCNFDDDGPQTWEELRDAKALCASYGERTFGVIADGDPVGYISWAPINSVVAMTRGIVFTQAVHGTGIPQIACDRVFREMFATGIQKLQAGYYVTNFRVATFLRGFGAVEEGFLRDQVRQHGQPVSMKLVAIFAPKEDVCH